MSIVIGIDVGGSTTKIVGYAHNEKAISRLKVEAADPVTSAYGALGKFINENNSVANRFFKRYGHNHEFTKGQRTSFAL